MAIAFDNSKSCSFGGLDHFNTTYTAATGALVLVGVVCNNANPINVAFASSNLPLLAKFTGNAIPLFVYGGIVGTSGAQSVELFAQSAGLLGCEISSYTGAAAVQPDNSSNATVASGTTVATTLTPVAANCWWWQFSRNLAGTWASVSSGTNRVSEATDGLAAISDSNTTFTGSTTVTTTWTGSAAAAAIMLSILPATTFTQSLTANLSFNGNGASFVVAPVLRAINWQLYRFDTRYRPEEKS